MPKRLSPDFALEELTFSQTAARQGITNRPDAAQIRALTDLCGHVLQPLRDALQQPISISSGFRSPRLNRALGGSQHSQHMDGEAADIVCFGSATKQLFKRIIELKLPFDQLIYEGGKHSIWVHVSFVPKSPRGEILAAAFLESAAPRLWRCSVGFPKRSRVRAASPGACMHRSTLTKVGAVVAVALCFSWSVGCAQEATETAAVVDNQDDSGGPDRWTSYVGLGAQLLPDYDETGRGSGLNKQEFFALVTVDGRFSEDCKSARAARLATCLNPLLGPWHTGVSLALLGTPVKRENKPSISPTEFNDVARSAVVSTYFYFPMLQSKDMIDNFGPIVRAAAISRENLDTNRDSVTWTYGLGLQYTSEGFRKNPENPKNGVPRGFVRLYATRFEDYAGFGESTRFLTDTAFRVSPAMDLYFGFQGNFGSGPDEMAVVVSFVRTPDQIASLFSLGKTQK